MIVHEICTRRVVGIDAAATVREAARRLCDGSIGGLVVTRAGRPAGIVTERDLVHRVLAAGVDPDATPVEVVMSHPILSVAADAHVDDAARRMRDHRVKRLLVLKDQEVWGIVTVTDIAHARPEITREFLDTWVRPRWED